MTSHGWRCAGASAVGGGFIKSSSSLLHPCRRVGITDKIEQPPQERDAVAAPEPELCCVWCERSGEGARVVVPLTEGVGDHMGHCLRVLAVEEEIRGDTRWAGYEESSKGDPLSAGQTSLVETDIRPVGLSPLRQREVVPIGRQVTETVHGGRRSMRDDALVGSTLPRGNIGGELKPRGAELDVVRDRCSGQVIHAVRDSLQDRLANQTLEGGRRDARALRLATGKETPLVLGDGSETAECGVACHACIVAQI